jgi:thiol:disulfide interchange protein
MWTVVLILLGGFLLNLTPCVLPMIPVNLAILGVGAQGSSRARGFGLGIAYGGGIAVVYGGLGLVVVLSGSQFGVLNSMPWFNAAIAVVFAVLGLAMFDVIQIDLTRFQGGVGGLPSRRGTYAAAAGMGGLAALLAGACVAPVVLAVLLLSSNLYAAGAAVGLVLPFVLGLGMALPWPLAGAGLAYIPRPGAWMSWVKYGFGVFIMAMALYYASVAFRGWRGPPAAGKTDAGVLSLSADEGPAAWTGVMDQSRASGKPVFVDFWASWCKNCEAMEATTFRDEQVRERLSGFIVVKCRAEHPNEAATRATLEHFGVMGLPTYVILKRVPGGPEARSP